MAAKTTLQRHLVLMGQWACEIKYVVLETIL